MKIILFCLAILLLIPFARSQQAVVRNVVFEGAGMRGIAYAGAIEELETRGLLAEIEKVGGTSAGAITALCLSLGYTANEIAELLYKTKFARFKDGRFFLFGGINRLKKYYGWYRGKKFTKWLGKIVEKKTGSSETTFEDLVRLGFRDLYVTATVINQQRIIILSAKTYPRMKVKDAVRISSSIPFFFEAMFVDSTGLTFHHPKNREGLDIMIDGGFSGNFPIHIFDSLMADNEREAMINTGTIGFRIDTEEQIKSDRNGKGLIEMPVNNFRQFGKAFYTMVMENLNRQALSKEDWKRTISISDAAVRPGIRRLSKKEIRALMESGRSATREFFTP